MSVPPGHTLYTCSTCPFLLHHLHVHPFLWCGIYRRVEGKTELVASEYARHGEAVCLRFLFLHGPPYLLEPLLALPLVVVCEGLALLREGS